VSFPRRIGADQATHAVEISSGLQTWQTDGESAQLTAREDLGDGRELLVYTVVNPFDEAESAAHLFVRIKVTQR
jgi:hypothetical protein